jgi:hypothetical protein
MSPANSSKPLIPCLRPSRKKEVTISIEEQRCDIKKWSAERGEQLAPEIVEQAVSGAEHWRDRGLGRAVAMVDAGEASGTATTSAAATTPAGALHRPAGDRTVAPPGPPADSSQALPGRPHPAGALQATGPCDRSEAEGRRSQAPRLPQSTWSSVRR